MSPWFYGTATVLLRERYFEKDIQIFLFPVNVETRFPSRQLLQHCEYSVISVTTDLLWCKGQEYQQM